MDPKIVSLPSFSVAGLMLRTDNKNNEIPPLWHQLVARMKEVPAVGRKSYGVCDGFEPATCQFDYLAGMEVRPDAALPADIAKWSIPAQTYAVFPCTLADIKQTYQMMYGQWLPNLKDWRQSRGPMFELYDEEFQAGPGGKLYLYVPVESKS